MGNVVLKTKMSGKKSSEFGAKWDKCQMRRVQKQHAVSIIVLLTSAFEYCPLFILYSSSFFFLPASCPPSRPLLPPPRWRAPARRTPARPPTTTTQLQTSKPPSSPKGCQKQKWLQMVKRSLPDLDACSKPNDFRLEELVFSSALWSWVKVSVCSYKVPLLAPPHFLQPDIKVNISCRPAFCFFHCLT